MSKSPTEMPVGTGIVRSLLEGDPPPAVELPTNWGLTGIAVMVRVKVVVPLTR
jgi:hypothetical protein